MLENYTGMAETAKETFDECFRISFKEDVEVIIREMKNRNTTAKSSSLGDLDEQILKIFGNDENYLSENKSVDYGKVKAKSLFEKRYEEEKERNAETGGVYGDLERNARVIEEYEAYASSLKSVDELDALFLERLDKITLQYKSSTDYMTRTVRRLLEHSSGYKWNANDTTRVLILKRLLNKFGYNCVNEIECQELENIVNEKYEGKIENIKDDIFEYLKKDEFIKSIVKFQGMVIYKSSIIRMTSELCKKLESVVESVGKGNWNILSSKAKNGTAKTLNECFENPESISVTHLKDSVKHNVEEINDLTNIFTLLCRKEKKVSATINRYIILARTYILLCNFGDKIWVDVKFKKLMKEICPSVKCFCDTRLGRRKQTVFSSIKSCGLRDDKIFNAVKELLQICEDGLEYCDWGKYVDLVCADVRRYSENDEIGELLRTETEGKILEKILDTLITKFDSEIVINAEQQDLLRQWFLEKTEDSGSESKGENKLKDDKVFNAVKELLQICEDGLEYCDWGKYVDLVCADVRNYLGNDEIGELLRTEIEGKILEKILDIVINKFDSEISIDAEKRKLLRQWFLKKFEDSGLENKGDNKLSEIFDDNVFIEEKSILAKTFCRDIVRQFIYKHDELLSEDDGREFHKLVCEGLKQDAGLFSIPLSFFYTDADVLIRLIVLFTRFASKIPVEKEVEDLLSKLLPSENSCNNEDVSLDKYLGTYCKTNIEYWSWKNQLQNKKIIKALVEKCEKYLTIEEEREYIELIHEKIRVRENEATKQNSHLWKSTCEVLDSKEKMSEYRLLAIADDLANARFNKTGKTREYLYIFAIAFDMTVSGYSDDESVYNETTNSIVLKEDTRKITDVQKNLFYDFYSDNLVNAAHKNASTADGYGINYKNFAEMAFVWSINQDVSAEEKLKSAYEIISHCKSHKPKGKIKKETQGHCDNITEKYKNEFKKFLNSNKSAIKDFLVDNYSYSNDVTVTAENAQSISAGIQLANGKERVRKLFSAYKESVPKEVDSIDSVIYKINESLNEKEIKYFIALCELPEKYCKTCARRKNGGFPQCSSYWGEDEDAETCWSKYKRNRCGGALKTDDALRNAVKKIGFSKKNGLKDFKKKITTVSCLCSDAQTNLKSVLEKIEKSIDASVLDENISDTWDEKNVSRTKLLVLCYFEMVLMNYLYRDYLDERDIVFSRSFEDYYNFFCKGRRITIALYDEDNCVDVNTTFEFPGADKILLEAGYQSINPKNILDMYIIFLAFRDNYKKMAVVTGPEDIINSVKKSYTQFRKLKTEVKVTLKDE